jgi:hypothetical protein
VKQLYQRLKEFESSSTIIDLGYWLQCYSFDVIGEITVSRPVDDITIPLPSRVNRFSLEKGLDFSTGEKISAI